MAMALLESLLREPAGRPVDPVSARAQAAARLLRDGLPDARDEAWKYTSLRALGQRRYVDGDSEAAMRTVDSSIVELPDIHGPRMVFVNGVFCADLSTRPTVTGLTLSTFAERPGELEAALQLDTDSLRSNAFERLNALLAADGPILHVDAGVDVTEPVHLVFVGAAAAADIAWQIRARIDLAAGAHLRVIEHHVAADAHAHFGNLVVACQVGEGAVLELVQIQCAAETSTLIRRDYYLLDRNARLSMHAVELGAQLTRHDLRIDLAGHGARVDSRGVFTLHGRQHGDTHLVVDHNAAGTISNIVWHGVADGRARGVFHGAITVAQGADGADAKLTNKNLLLSAQAEIDTQPALEICADEVKAAHGATVGQLDETALFYLRSRGIPEQAARSLLVAAFCRAVLADVPHSALLEHLQALLDSRLPAIGVDV